MPSGTLDVHLTDLTGEPVRNIDIKLSRFAGEPGTGGETMHVALAGPIQADDHRHYMSGRRRNHVQDVADAEHYRPYAFFQLILEDRVNTASDLVEFWVHPGDVKDIKAPTFADLSARARRILEKAEMTAAKEEDSDLLNLTGEDLYRAAWASSQSVLPESAHEGF